MYHEYKKNCNWLKRGLTIPLLHYMRRWDQLSSMSVSHFVANSQFVAGRIKSFYHRQAKIIHPPVDVSKFSPTGAPPEDYYLLLGQLVPYKKADLAIKAFNMTGRKLKVVGEGEQLRHLHQIAKSNIDILGWQPFSEVRRLLSNCKALIFPGVEDFGIVPLEAMASGRPVIAYKAGGALDTVNENLSGLFFKEQTELSLNQAIDRFEKNIGLFETASICNYVQKFGKENFKIQFKEYVDQAQV